MMGSLAALEQDKGPSNDFVALGLYNVRNDHLKKPQILSLFSALLERSVEKNERLLETSQARDIITIFHGLRAPSLTIHQYVDRIFKYSSCSPSCFVVAHVYIDRFIQRTNLILTSLNIHRLLITSIMLAAKFMDDAFFNNAYYARVGGVTTAELNKLEMKFLFGLDFRLHVSVDTFKKHCSMLKMAAVSVEGIERQMMACKMEENWTSKR